MRRLLGLVLVLTMTGLSRSADLPQHNKLTPQEIAEGWISLFDGETTYGWTAPNGSKWTIADGMLAPQAGKHGLLVTTSAFGDYDLKIQYRMRRNSQAAVFVFCDAAARGAERIQAGKRRPPKRRRGKGRTGTEARPAVLRRVLDGSRHRGTRFHRHRRFQRSGW